MSLQNKIIAELGVKAHIDISTEINRRVDFIADYIRSAAAAGVVLGISGGQDSTLAGRLCQLAVEKLRESGYAAKFCAIRLPYGVQADEEDARLALTFIAPDEVLTLDIRAAVDAAKTEIDSAFAQAGQIMQLSDFHKGNVKARMRMLMQFAVAGQQGLLVVGTDHAAEAVTGFFTKFGDGAADIMPLAGLTKSQGAKMLASLNAPERTWKKSPTADLLDENPGQTDEDSLGITYQEIDAYLIGAKIAPAKQELLESKFLATAHKRKLPPGPDNDWWRA